MSAQLSIVEERVSRGPNYLRGLGFDVYEDHGSSLNIIRASSNVNMEALVDEGVDLKGVIYDRYTDKVVAPGVPIPISTIDADPEEILSLAPDIAYIYEGLDGMLLRLYHHDGRFRVSTNGTIEANRDIQDMFNQFGVRSDLLNPKWCYYVVMQHLNHTNIVKHRQNSLTLTRIVDCETMLAVPLEQDTQFNGPAGELRVIRTIRYETPDQYKEHIVKAREFDESRRLRPVQSVGLIIVTKQDLVYRIDSPEYREAISLRANQPRPEQHWSALYNFEVYQKGGTIDTRYGQYLAYFEWNRGLFSSLEMKFHRLVQELLLEYQGKTSVPARHRNIQQRLSSIELTSADDVAEVVLSQGVQTLDYLMETGSPRQARSGCR